MLCVTVEQEQTYQYSVCSSENHQPLAIESGDYVVLVPCLYNIALWPVYLPVAFHWNSTYSSVVFVQHLKMLILNSGRRSTFYTSWERDFFYPIFHRPSQDIAETLKA